MPDNPQEIIEEQQIERGLSKEQKIGFVLLGIFALVSISLGILQIRNTLYGHFALNRSVPPSIKDDVNGIDALRFRDTDNDGIKDFEEIYRYGTSPYLYDTFGYGMSDKEVAAKGLPLCPKGNCVIDIDNTAPTSSSSVISPLINRQDPGLPPVDLNTMFQDPKQIREMLVNAGVKPEMLRKINDSELMNLVSQIMLPSSTAIGLPNVTNTKNNIQILNSVASSSKKQ